MKPIIPVRKSSMQEVVEPSFGETKAPSRVETRRTSAENINAIDIDGVFSNLFEIMGQFDTTSFNQAVSNEQVDMLVAELVSVRNAKDVIEGREGALKTYATELINARLQQEGKDPSETSGSLSAQRTE